MTEGPEKSWDELIRFPAPAYSVLCDRCPKVISGNNYRKVRTQLRDHKRSEHE